MDQAWWVARIVVNRPDYESAVACIAQTQTLGFTEDFTPSTATLHVYLPLDTDTHAFSLALSEWVPYLSCDIDKIGRENWADNWKQHFSPFSIATGIVIKPSWEEYHAASDETVIELDPGMAFGTGTHETTRLCAQALVEAMPLYDHPTVCDIGCGSGILAIIAAKRGSPTVIACDNDTVALDVAKENAVRNGITSIPFYQDMNEIKGTFDIVLANILLNTLIEFKETIVAKMKPGGRLITSGITTDQVDRLIASFAPLTSLSVTTNGEWAAVTFG